MADADSSLCIDDSMPGHRAVRRQCVQSIADEARLPGKTCEHSHVAIGRHLADGDLPDDGIDAVVTAGGPNHDFVLDA